MSRVIKRSFGLRLREEPDVPQETSRKAWSPSDVSASPGDKSQRVRREWMCRAACHGLDIPSRPRWESVCSGLWASSFRARRIPSGARFQRTPGRGATTIAARHGGGGSGNRQEFRVYWHNAPDKPFLAGRSRQGSLPVTPGERVGFRQRCLQAVKNRFPERQKRGFSGVANETDASEEPWIL